MISVRTIIPTRFTQTGFVLLPVVLALALMAVIAFMLNNQGAMNVGSGAGDAEAKRAEYLASAGLEHAVWGLQNNACAGDMSMTAVPFGQGSDTYTATVTAGGSTTAYSLSADQDSWFRSDDVTNNNGGPTSSLHLRMELGNLEYAVIRFDLSSLPANAQINSAAAWFYIDAAKGHPEGPVTVHGTTADWTEADATWGTMATNFDAAILGMIPSQPAAGGNWVRVNLTAQVQAWVNGQPNYGVMLIPQGEGTHAEYISREGAVSQAPRLEVIVGNSPASPANIQATGTLDNGVTRTLSRPLTAAYQPPSFHTLSPGAAESDDAEIWGQSPNNNYGDAAETWVSSMSNDTTRSLLRFNMGAIPAGAKILAATLSLSRQSGTGANQPVSAHRISNPWSEGSVTWNSREVGTNWDTAGGDFDAVAVATTPVGPSNSRYEWHITPLVQGWVDGSYPNYGVALIAAIPGMPGHRFYTSDQAVFDRRPSLSVNYACECGSACLAPQGSGKIALIGDDSSPDPYDQLKIEIIESWGYEVNFYEDLDSGSINWSNYDLAYVSETVISGDVSANLANLSIGVVNEEPKLYDDLQLANGDTEHVGSSIDITDNSHFITSIFPQGPLLIYDADMEILTADTPLAVGLQTLGEYSSAASLTALDKGAQTTSGTAAGRRVTLPLGQHFASNFDWTLLNNNGRLLVQRAIQWGTGNIAGIVSAPIILSTDGDASLGGLSFTDIDIANYDPDAGTASLFFDGGLTTLNSDIDAVHILANGHILLSTKDTDTLGGLNFLDGDLVDYDPGTDTASLYFDEFAFSADEDIVSVYLMSNGHLVLSTDSDASLGGLNFTDNDLVEYDPATDTATLFFDGGATTLSSDIDAVHVLDNGHIVLSTKDDDSLGGLSFKDGDLVDYDPVADTAVLYFDEGLFSADENIKSAHIGPGSGALGSDTQNLLLVVVDPSALTLQETRKKDLIESWGYSVNLIDVNDSQAAFDTAVAANNVVFISEDISSGDLNTKLVNATIGVVTEEDNLSDEFGLSQSIGWETGTLIEVNDNTHYITSPFPLGILTIASTSESLAYVTGTLAPDLGQLVSTTSGFGLVTLDTGGSMYGGGNAAGRRVQLPWGGNDFDINNLNADGRTLMQRALEWGAGAVTGPIAHWKLDDGTGLAAIDSEGGNDGTLNGNPSWTTGTLDGALDFDGSGDYVTTDNPFTPPPIGTVTFWMQVSGSPASHGRILGLDDTWEIRHVTTGTPDGIPYGLVFDLGVSGVNTEFVTTTTIDTAWQWYHIAASYNTSNDAYAVYIDGVLHKSGTYPSSLSVPAANLLSLGTRTGSTNYFDGALDDVRIYDRFLSASEIADLAATGGGGGGGCDGTFRDEFNVRQYDQNDGTLIWATDWEETGETTSPTGGDIQIENDASNYQLRVRDDGQTVMREADLRTAASATLSFDYRRENLSGSSDYVAVEVSYNGGSSWVELDRFIGTADDGSYTSTSYVLDAGSLSATTRIRFLTPTSGMGNSNMVLFDNVQILCTP